MSENGKGDTPRPMSVDRRTFSMNWERIFQTQKKKVDKQVEELQSEIDKVKEIMKEKQNELIQSKESGSHPIG